MNKTLMSFGIVLGGVALLGGVAMSGQPSRSPASLSQPSTVKTLPHLPPELLLSPQATTPQVLNDDGARHGITPTEQYQWPSGDEVPVLRRFAPGEQNWNRGHRGVDLALGADDPVYAAGAGTVIYAGQLNDRALVSIEHPDGIRTTYEPIVPTVSKGDPVAAGQLIGTVDGTHCGMFSCLHWGAKRGADSYLDPIRLLRGPIRLLK